MKKKSFVEKLFDTKDLPKIVYLDDAAALHWGGKSMAIPSPLDVFNLMAQIPKGKVTTINEIRKVIARKYNTDIACPLTTGIFATISAKASVENDEAGNLPKLSYWRVLKSNGELNDKFPGGIDSLAEKLSSEGFEIVRKGKKAKVKDFEKYLFSSLDFKF